MCHCFQFFPFYLLWSIGTGCHDLSLFNIEFQARFFTFLFHLIKSTFSSSSLSAIRVISSAYLRLLPYFLKNLITAWASYSLAFHMMYSACKWNKQQDDNIDPCHTPFPTLNQSVVSCQILIVSSWPAYRFLRRQVRWSCILISLRISHSLLWSTESKVLAYTIKILYS